MVDKKRYQKPTIESKEHDGGLDTIQDELSFETEGLEKERTLAIDDFVESTLKMVEAAEGMDYEDMIADEIDFD